MGTKRKVIVIILALIALIVLIPYILMIPDPIRRPLGMARNYVLRLTPIGMDMEEVIEVLEGHRNWHINSPNLERGFSDPFHASGNMVGVKSITAGIGSYWPAPIPVPLYGWLFRTEATIFWGFDENGKLIDVFVRQSHGG